MGSASHRLVDFQLHGAWATSARRSGSTADSSRAWFMEVTCGLLFAMGRIQSVGTRAAWSTPTWTCNKPQKWKTPDTVHLSSINSDLPQYLPHRCFWLRFPCPWLRLDDF